MDGGLKRIVYNLVYEKEKIWANILNKSVLHKAGSKTSLFYLHKFVMFHLMENLLFDLPHTIYINRLRSLKSLGGLFDICNATLINKLLWDQELYHVFNKMGEDSEHTMFNGC